MFCHYGWLALRPNRVFGCSIIKLVLPFCQQCKYTGATPEKPHDGPFGLPRIPDKEGAREGTCTLGDPRVMTGFVGHVPTVRARPLGIAPRSGVAISVMMHTRHGARVNLPSGWNRGKYPCACVQLYLMYAGQQPAHDVSGLGMGFAC